MTICIFGKEFDVKITKKNIKNMYLRVNNNMEICVSAPVYMPDSEIEKFVLSKRDWLSNALDRALKKNKFYTYDDGEIHYLFGNEYYLQVKTGKKMKYLFKNEGICLYVGEDSTVETRKNALAEVYRDIMEKILPDIADKCMKSSGIYANGWKLRNMKSRWGSCNTKTKEITINLWLTEKPIECLQAVVYHELAHIKVHGHNKEFYTLLEKICPFYKEAEKMLKR